MVTGITLRGLPCGAVRWTATAVGRNRATAAVPWDGPPIPAMLAAQAGLKDSGFADDTRDEVDPGNAGGEATARGRQHLADRTAFHDAPAVDHDHLVGDGEGVEQVVGDDDGSAVLVAQDVSQQPSESGCGGDVECGHRFVEEQHLWFRGECAGDGDTLGLPAGELCGTPVGEGGPRRRLRASAAHRAGIGAAVALTSRSEGDVGGNRHVREQQCLLRQHGDAAVVRGNEDAGTGVGDDPITQGDPAAVGSQQAGDQQQQAGLSGTVGAQDGEYLAVVEAEVELDATLFEAGLHMNAAHSAPDRRRLAEATTMSAATTISSSDSATAASGSVSRCR